MSIDDAQLHFALTRDMLLTANERKHWAKKARTTAILRQLAVLEAARFNAKHEPFTRAHLTVHVGWPDKRRRDVANVAPTIKALIDGCVDAGLLPDDDDEHLVGPDLRPYFAGVHDFEDRRVTVLDFEFVQIVDATVIAVPAVASAKVELPT